MCFSNPYFVFSTPSNHNVSVLTSFLTAWKSFNKRIQGIQAYETFPATIIISDVRDGESVVIRELWWKT